MTGRIVWFSQTWPLGWSEVCQFFVLFQVWPQQHLAASTSVEGQCFCAGHDIKIHDLLESTGRKTAIIYHMVTSLNAGEGGGSLANRIICFSFAGNRVFRLDLSQT